MKKLLLIIISLLLFSCKSREKSVSKSETQSEYKGESTAKIQEQTFEITFDKSVLKQDFSYKNSSSETYKQEKKNVDKGKEYYENGTLKKEWERDISELSESAKSVLEEINTKLIQETEASKYWEKSSDFYAKSLEQEKTKTKDYEMKLKAKETFSWQMFFVGLFLGTIIIRPLLRWVWSWVKRFQPWIKFVEWIKNFKK